MRAAIRRPGGMAGRVDAKMAGTMPAYTLSALNVRTYPLGENDKILVALTRERGIVRLVARGARKPRNRWGGRLEPLVRATLEVSTGRGALDVITSALPYGPSATLMADFDRLMVGFRLAEAAVAIVAEGQPNAAAFDRLEAALDLLAEGARPEAVALWCELGLLDVGGYRPELEVCVACGAPVADSAAGPFAYSALGGGVRCGSCPGSARSVGVETLLLLGALRDAEIDTVRGLTRPLPGEGDAALLLADTLQACADVRLRANDMARRLSP